LCFEETVKFFTQYYYVEVEYGTVPLSANFMLTRRIKPCSINWAEFKSVAYK